LDTNQAFLDVRNQTFCMANPFGMEPVVGSRVVADAVRDLLTTALRGRPPDHPDIPPRRSRRPRADPWDDHPDDWHRDDGDEYDPNGDEPAERSRRPVGAGRAPRPSTPWASALSAGVLVARWLLAHRLRVWPAVGAGVAVSALALAGGPAVRAACAALSAAVDLICLTQPD
jgi:hypothetical protein